MTQKNDRMLEKMKELDVELINLGSDELLSSDLPDKCQDSIFSSYNTSEIHILTNFSIIQFNELFRLLETQFSRMRNTRGKKSKLSDKDMLLMFLYYLKSYVNFNKLAMDYKISTSTAKKLIQKMIKNFRDILVNKFISWIPKEEQNKNLLNFEDFNEVALVLDCSVQEICKFGGNFKDTKPFFSQKHGKYCVKKRIWSFTKRIMLFN